MNISERAEKYLNLLKRDLKWTSGKEEIKNYLKSQNFDLIDEFVRFQMLYSGFELTVRNKKNHSFSAALFSKKQIKNNNRVEFEQAGERKIHVCGFHATAQFTFYLTDKGEICTLDDEDLPNIIYSSFDKMLEVYALKNEIFNWASNPYYFKVQKIEGLMDLMNNDFSIIHECSDNYSTWWKKNDLIAVKGIWLDSPNSYFHVYGKKRADCDSLIEKLQKIELLK